MPGTITVVITTYNRKHLLREAVDSVLAQTHREFALYIFDNASTDGTDQLVATYAHADHRVHLWKQPYNVGSGRNIRTAFFTPSTDYVAWLMDDDVWFPDHLENGLNCLATNRASIMYSCAAKTIGGSSEEVLSPHFVPTLREATTFDFTKDFSGMLINTAFVGSAVIFQRKALSGVRMWSNDNVAMDWLVWGQLALQGPIVYNPSPHIYYRRHELSDSFARLGGRRGVAQTNYIRRTLAMLALDVGALNPDRLYSFLVEFYDHHTVRAVCVTLSTFDTPKVLRRIARRIFRERPEILSGRGYWLFRLARKAGGLLFPWFDIAYRIAGFWWPRRFNIERCREAPLHEVEEK